MSQRQLINRWGWIAQIAIEGGLWLCVLVVALGNYPPAAALIKKLLHSG